ncbi:pirin family protein, partial [Candidatus Poribacteria bacterium]|nr:pirin family protein [Candidatus Poribacteria bacterium]
NEDVIQARRGFGTHPHRDMEIVTVVLEGALTHEDSMGSRATLRPGIVQRMSAGTGIMHSEMNDSDAPCHLYQTWIMPDGAGHQPRYEDRPFDLAARRDRLRLIVSPDGRDGSLDVHQDVSIYDAALGSGVEVAHALADGRHAWIQVAAGSVHVNGETLEAGDAAAVSDEAALSIAAIDDAEFLLFDLA